MSDIRDYMLRCSEKTLQSNSKGFFMQFADGVSQIAGEEWIRNVFGKLKTDKDRIRAIYEDGTVKDIVLGTLSHVEEIYRRKSAEVAMARRLEAQKVYSLSKDAEKALILASQSVLRAPPTGVERVENGKTLGLSLWFRSELLLALEKFDLALKDVQWALKENLDERLKADAFSRMALCYKALGELKKSKVSQDLALKLLETEESKNNFLKALESVNFVQNNQKEQTLATTHIEKVPKSTNKISEKLKVSEHKRKGRHFIATGDFKTNETVIEEVPYASCLLPDNFGTHCHHCYRILDVAMGCWDCSSVAFCGQECRDEALRTYHKHECHFLDLLIGSGMSILAHVALRMVTQSPVEALLDMHNAKLKKLIDKNGKNIGTEKVFELCTLSHLRQPEDFLQRTLMAAFLLRCLQKCGYFGYKDENVQPNENQLKIGEMLLYNLQMLQFNAHEIYETVIAASNGHRFKGSAANYIGVAVYPTAALFNHHCDPNLNRYFVGKSIILKSSRPINAGDEVSENYGSHFSRKSLKDRRKYLAGRYWFDCKCQACAEDWPQLQSLDQQQTRRIKCPNKSCKYLFSLPIVSETPKCPRCLKKVQLGKRIEELAGIELMYEEAFVLMNQEKTQEAKAVVTEALDRFFAISECPHKGTQMAQECLRALDADGGNVRVLKFA